uniref:29 kDa protein n=1 Tax=Pea early browning virus TaxID=12294 RepID=O91256_PEBV|nr:29 kDa protein [Pea early-browning virus]
MGNGDWSSRWPNDHLFIDDFGKLVWFDALTDIVRISHFVSQVPTDLSPIPSSYISFIDGRIPMCVNHLGWVYIRVKFQSEEVYYQKFGEVDVSGFGESELPPDFEITFKKVTTLVDRSLMRKAELLEKTNAELRLELSNKLVSLEKEKVRLQEELSRKHGNFAEMRDGLILNFSKVGGRIQRMIVRSIQNQFKLVSEINNDGDRWATMGASIVLREGTKYLGFSVVTDNGRTGVEFDLTRLNALDAGTLLASVV